MQQSRQVPAAQGLDWARRRGCGFMETSARLEVNIEETFALIVRRVAERRRLALMGLLDDSHMTARGMTKPLTPLPADADGEKHPPGLHPSAAARLPGPDDADSGFWRKLRCW
ncbi:hypothetical protein CDD83_5532 [Cordyceps sp. RAO-2017]|nr:hypothetical protein CDD83_5532 [Cordyceps sp. RAO-2017]